MLWYLCTSHVATVGCLFFTQAPEASSAPTMDKACLKDIMEASVRVVKECTVGAGFVFLCEVVPLASCAGSSSPRWLHHPSPLQ